MQIKRPENDISFAEIHGYKSMGDQRKSDGQIIIGGEVGPFPEDKNTTGIQPGESMNAGNNILDESGRQEDDGSSIWEPWHSLWWFLPFSGMDKVNQYLFYEFGSSLREARELRAGMKLRQYAMLAAIARNALAKFLNESSHVPRTRRYLPGNSWSYWKNLPIGVGCRPVYALSKGRT